MKGKHLILWDGDCGFCRRAMGWLMVHDRYGRLQAMPNQEADLSPALREACQKALHVVKSDGKILRAGRAALFCGQQTRWHQLARMGEWLIFLPFVELGYAFVASHRAQLSKFFFTRERPLANSE